MKTESLLIQNLCVPCACRCRHCLLSWDGRPVGVPWERGAGFALRFRDWQRINAPELRFAYSFGYAMEPPDWHGALSLLRALGSPHTEFLHCDGLRLRGKPECDALAHTLAEEGIRRLHFTFYGLSDYHDRFAGRRGDFDFLLRMMDSAVAAGMAVGAGMALTSESAPQADELVGLLRGHGADGGVFLFVPHGEGRGAQLQAIRFSLDDLGLLSDDTAGLLDRRLYRTEAEWLAEKALPEETRRTLLVSLRPDNIGRYESMDPGAVISEIETLDEAYYAAFPAFPALAARFGDPKGERFYRYRDLFSRYRSLYAAEHAVAVYDVTDERQSGSRRY